MAARISTIARQPTLAIKAALVGRKISWPAALAAVRSPTTIPCRAWNQRAAM